MLAIIMKKTSIITLILLTLLSCQNDKLEFRPIDFNTDYQFNEKIFSKIEDDTTGQEIERLATEFSLKGDYSIAQRLFDSIFKSKNKITTSKSRDSLRGLYKKVSAKNYILDISKQNSLIIINEAHHVPYHRIFTKSLLAGLYENGYKHLGLEGLDRFDTLINNRGYPIKKSGYYTKEPEFGNMIRTAIDIGFNVFGYEDWDEARKGPEFREIAQAKNIKKVIDANPNDKILIHCGYLHASEGENDFWKKAMALRLSELTHIDPLTIDQTKYIENFDQQSNNIFLNSFEFTEPTILLDANKKPLPYIRDKDKMDLVVFHPITQIDNLRPNWKFKKRKQIQLDISNLEIEYPIMVFAFNKNDDINDATPIDILELNKNTNPKLALVKGDYQIVITNGKKSFAVNQIVE